MRLKVIGGEAILPAVGLGGFHTYPIPSTTTEWKQRGLSFHNATWSPGAEVFEKDQAILGRTVRKVEHRLNVTRYPTGKVFLWNMHTVDQRRRCAYFCLHTPTKPAFLLMSEILALQ